MEPWLQLLQTFGVAVTCLLALSYGVYRAAKWMAVEVLVPTRDLFFRQILATMARVEDTTKHLETAEGHLSELLEERTKRFDSIEQKLAVIAGSQTELKAEIEDLRLSIEKALKASRVPRRQNPQATDEGGE